MKAKILALFEKITVNNLSYCLLCYKTSEERNIVVSRHFPAFLETLNFNINLQWGNVAAVEKTTCFVCEAKLEKAASLVKMIKNGMRMKNLLNYCQEYRKTNTLLNSCLNSSEPVETLRNKHPMFMVAYECQNQLADIQKQTDLETTDILTIDTIGHAPQTTPPPEDRDDDDVVLIEDTIQTPSLPDLQNPINTARRKSAQINQNTNKTPRIIAKPKKPLKEPEKTMKTSLTEPIRPFPNSLSDPVKPPSPIAQNPLLLNSLMTPQKPIPSTNADVTGFADKMVARQRPDGNFELHKIIIGTDGVPYIPTLSAKLVNGQIVMINQVGSEPVNTLSTTMCDANNILEDTNVINVAKVEGNKRTVEEETPASEPARRLLKTSHNTDWEDKIPMDVITYVDATDPNISANIMHKEESILPDISPRKETTADVKTDPELIDITDEAFLTSNDGIGIITSCYSERNLI